MTVNVPVLVLPLYDAVITTPVLAGTGWVVMAKPPVKPTLGTVTLAGTLAIAGLLLERATTAPPSGAGTLRMTVPDESLPPTTLDGLMSRLVKVAGGGAACGVKLRTEDHGPVTPAVLIPRTRQKCVAVESPVVAYIDDVTVASRTSGAPKALESSI